MQLTENCEALHLPLGQNHWKQLLFKGLGVEGKLRAACQWQECCQQHASAWQPGISRLFSHVLVCLSHNHCDIGPCEA